MVNFRLDKKSPVPFYRQIVDMVLAGISSGAIEPGDRLPTIRDLAVKLEVNPNTVVKAYSQLQMMGVLDMQQGTGAFARARAGGAAVPAAERKRTLAALCRDFVGRAQLLNIGTRELIEYLARMEVESKSPSKD
ncbi:MAG: GntR family transcriptional regulator [Candidatus Brocadiia bacterium]